MAGCDVSWGEERRAVVLGRGRHSMVRSLRARRGDYIRGCKGCTRRTESPRLGGLFQGVRRRRRGRCRSLSVVLSKDIPRYGYGSESNESCRPGTICATVDSPRSGRRSTFLTASYVNARGLISKACGSSMFTFNSDNMHGLLTSVRVRRRGRTRVLCGCGAIGKVTWRQGFPSSSREGVPSG